MQKLCFFTILLLPYLLISPTIAKTHRVKLKDITLLDGEKIKYSAGDIFLIPKGNYTQLVIKNFKGTSKKPVIFTNNGGLVKLHNTKTKGGALTIHGCKHLHFTGSNTNKIKYGFQLSCGKNGPHAVNVIGRSSSIEIDNIEISGAGFAGFNVKDEPSKQHKTTREQFVMRNISLHDNYVHSVKGEGFYVGHTFFLGYDPKKTGKPLYPHLIKGLRIYNNICENTGCEGIQVSSTPIDCEIFNNIIINPGKSPFAKYQNNGLQIGLGAQAKVYNNYIENIPGNGIVLFGHGEIELTRNTIVNPKQNGMYVNTKGAHSYFISGNTVIHPKDDGFLIGNWNKNPAKITLKNNYFVFQSKKNKAIINQNTKVPIKETGTRSKVQTNIDLPAKPAQENTVVSPWTEPEF